MLTFLRSSSTHKLQEEEGKGIYSLSRKTFVCSWLATSHSNTNQLPLTKERSADTPVPERLSNVGIHSKGRARIIVVCVVCERKHFSSKKANPDNPSPRQLLSAASAMFTCALEKEDQFASMTTILRKTVLARDNK